MAKQWMKLWKEKLWSSVNFNLLPFSPKGAYLLFLTMARDDGIHEGKLCFPNGNPIAIEELANVIKIQPSHLKRHVETLIERGFLFWESNTLCIRNYEMSDTFSENNQNTSGKPPEKDSNMSGKTLEYQPSQVPINQELTTPLRTEENRTEENRTEENRTEDIPTPSTNSLNGSFEERIVQIWNVGANYPISIEKGRKFVQGALEREAKKEDILSAVEDAKLKQKYKFYEVMDGLCEPQKYRQEFNWKEFWEKKERGEL